VAHSAEGSQKSNYLCELESKFETALDHKSGDQLGTIGEITLYKKISHCCPFKSKDLQLPAGGFRISLILLFIVHLYITL
jgi:hypothetical protein